jgi:hypothetical protein
MEEVKLASLFGGTYYLFSTGRRHFAMLQVKSAAISSGYADIASHCDVAIAHDRQTRDLEAVWVGQKPDGQFSPEARQLDIYVDAAVVALRDGIDAAARTSAPGDPLGEAAVKLGQELYPQGAAAITTLPFVDELGQVQRILARVSHADWASTVQALGLSRHVARLAALEPQYSAAIGAPGAKVTFAQVKDARAKGQSLMLQAVAMILGRHPSDSPADLAGRAALLGPIHAQNEAIRGYLRSRRAVEDVNPETGEVEPAAPQGSGAPAAGGLAPAGAPAGA